MLRVLVVDDYADSAISLQWLLQAWGYEAHIATDGPTALQIAESYRPDVVILDLAMPEMDGFEVAKRLRLLDPHKPIIITHSGYNTKDDIRSALEVGCIYYLTKPAEPDEIQRLLEICERWMRWKP